MSIRETLQKLGKKRPRPRELEQQNDSAEMPTAAEDEQIIDVENAEPAEEQQNEDDDEFTEVQFEVGKTTKGKDCLWRKGKKELVVIMIKTIKNCRLPLHS
jgi:hypothetical protein